VKPLELIAKARVEHWVIASAFILLLDYLTGPFIQFPILFVVPVAVAVLLPLVTIVILPEMGASGPVGAGMGGHARRCSYPERIRRDHSSDRPAAAPNQGAQGVLPICSFCKRIRDQDEQWRRMESFISERSSARFSHTFCEQCGKVHYPGLVD